MPGIVTSQVEVVQVTPFGLWVAVDDREYFLDFKLFPWFKKATIDAIGRVEEVAPGHLFWPSLDVDLDIDTIMNPEEFPLVAR
jgi:hypothetical protein